MTGLWRQDVRISDTGRSIHRHTKNEVLFRICDFMLESDCMATSYEPLAWFHERP